MRAKGSDQFNIIKLCIMSGHRSVLAPGIPFCFCDKIKALGPWVRIIALCGLFIKPVQLCFIAVA